LLVNPWIYDFAAHNLWIEPLGLLTIASALCDKGYSVTVIDCLAPHPGAPQPRANGSGKFLKTRVDKPAALALVPRHYGRYGLPLEQFDAALAVIPTPDLVLVASGMTYWYPGVVEAIRKVRDRWGAVPVALGGIYATLCPEHARQFSGADLVIEGPGVAASLRFAGEVTGHRPSVGFYGDPRSWPAPAHDSAPRPFAGLVTSWGCPFQCTYCASHRLQPVFVRRDPGSVVSEVVGCVQRGISHFAFYDDALLVDGGEHLGAITPELARLMRRAGFATVRLSLETADTARQQATGGKVTTAAFQESVEHLRAAGFGPAQLGAYILAGLPGAPLSEVETTVRLVHSLGVQAKLALFSPIPGTPEGDRALPADADHLLHNNTAYPYLLGNAHARELERVKMLAKEGNEALLRSDSQHA